MHSWPPDGVGPFPKADFDVPGLRYEPETAERFKIDGRLTVLPAVQTRKVEIIKVAPSFKSAGLMMAQKSITFQPF